MKKMKVISCLMINLFVFCFVMLALQSNNVVFSQTGTVKSDDKTATKDAKGKTKKKGKKKGKLKTQYTESPATGTTSTDVNKKVPSKPKTSELNKPNVEPISKYPSFEIGLLGQFNVSRYSDAGKKYNPRPGGGGLVEMWFSNEFAATIWMHYSIKEFTTGTGVGRADFLSFPLGAKYRLGFDQIGIFATAGPFIDIKISSEFEETKNYDYIFEFDGFKTVSFGGFFMVGADMNIGFGSLFLQTGLRQDFSKSVKGETTNTFQVQGGKNSQEISVFVGFKVPIEKLLENK